MKCDGLWRGNTVCVTIGSDLVQTSPPNDNYFGFFFAVRSEDLTALGESLHQMNYIEKSYF